MAMRCLGRARFTGAAALPLLFSFLRAVDLAAALRAGDFFCAAVLAAARAVGLLDFRLGFFLAIDVLPFRYPKRLAQMALRRVGKGALAPCPPTAGRTKH